MRDHLSYKTTFIYEICKNSVPRKFPTIQYVDSGLDIDGTSVLEIVYCNEE